MPLIYHLSCNKLFNTISSNNLMIGNIPSKNTESGEDEVIFEIIHYAMNTKKRTNHQNNAFEIANAAGKYKYTQNIYYSENCTNYWGNPVETHTFCDNRKASFYNAKHTALYKFLFDGYYLIEGIIASTNSETNGNLESMDLNEELANNREAIKAFSNLIIHINHGLRPTQFKKNIEIQYVERVETPIVYPNN